MSEVMMQQVLERLRREPRVFWIKLALTDGSTWFVRTGADGEVTATLPNGQTVGVIVRSDEYSVGALLAGKLSWADALVAKRVALSGDLALIATLQQSLVS